MNEQRIAELETQLQVERNEHDQREYQVNSLHVDNVELRRQLEIERELTHEFATKLALCQEELEQYKATVLLSDPAVAEELEAHGLDIKGVPV